MAYGDYYNNVVYNYGWYCGQCRQYVTYNGHICANQWQYTFTPSTQQFTQLESKPKYEEHTLECGCKVKTVVTEHCETLHKAPKDE